MGKRYLRGYIGDNESKQYWLREHTAMREQNIFKIRENAGEYPQKSYYTVVCLIQSDWIFIQCVTWDTGDMCVGVEETIRENVFHRLFFSEIKSLSPIVGDISTMPVKKYVLVPMNPVTLAKDKCLSSQK